MTGLFASNVANSQSMTTANHQVHPELAVEYNFLRSNAPPGGCGCFDLNGGNVDFAWPLGSSKFSLAGDIGVSHANSITSSGYDLTLGTYTLGSRYSMPLKHTGLRLFGQILAGAGHASGSLTEANGSDKASTAFAGIAGGGLDVHASRHFLVRIVEANYIATTFSNGSNDHQNNLRIATGLIFAF